jgi:hypothetical protein
MCPFCLATAAWTATWIAAAAVSTGGVTALAIRKVAKAANGAAENQSSKEDRNGWHDDCS